MKPQGVITRGTTHPNRLRRIDRWLIHAACGFLRAAEDPPLIVDLGYGANPVTSAELYQRLSKHVRPDLRVLGLEIDPERVAAAQPWVAAGLSFARGGFELGPASQPPAVIRAFNVLRQYDEAEVAPAWQRMASRLAPGGLLVEGTCDEIGRRAAWIRVGHDGRPQSLTFSTHVGSLSRPSDLAERLPKALIHRNVPGQRIHEVLRGLDRAWDLAAPTAVFGPRQRWVEMATRAAESGIGVASEPARWRLGELSLPWPEVAPET